MNVGDPPELQACTTLRFTDLRVGVFLNVSQPPNAVVVHKEWEEAQMPSRGRDIAEVGKRKVGGAWGASERKRWIFDE